MPTRIVENISDLKMLFRYLEGQKLPVTVRVETGGKRTARQNKLQRRWMQEIAEQLGDVTPEEVRGMCKLHFGVPIMREEDDEFRAKYDAVLRPLPYENKLLMMQEPLDFPITRLMSTRQKTAYLDAIWQHFTAKGIVLTDPGELGAVGEKRAA